MQFRSSLARWLAVSVIAVASLHWGVFTLGEMGFGAVTTISKISHVDPFGGTTTKVPEPGSLALLGTGLLALGVVRRRRPI